MPNILNFTCTKEITVADDISLPYFQFYFNWVIQTNLADRAYVSSFTITSKVVLVEPQEPVIRSETHPQSFTAEVRSFIC